MGLTQSNNDESLISPNDVVGKVFGPEHSGRVRCLGMGATPSYTFRNTRFRRSDSNSSFGIATSPSNFWKEKYTHLESNLNNITQAFKAYMIMKEGRIPDELVSVFGSSNVSIFYKFYVEY